MTRYVFVHGAFHGAWCWDDVLAPLNAAGHDARAIDLPASGSDTTPIETVTLESYVDRVVAELQRLDEPAVLVGHSMGGVPITATAAIAPEAVKQLVYVAALLPSDGETLLALTAKPEGQGDLVQANMVVTGQPPVATMSREAAIAAFYAECATEVGERAADKVGPQAVLPFVTPVKVDESRQPPRRYVFTLQDKSIPLPLQRRMARDNPVVESAELDTGHSPFLSMPTELAAILISFGR